MQEFAGGASIRMPAKLIGLGDGPMRLVWLLSGVTLLSLLSARPGIAATDYGCVSDCTQQGYLYSYCVSRCSYQNAPPAMPTMPTMPAQHGTDYRCVSNCTGRGYLYQYCVQSCSY
jgi:hypothetical protein